MFWPRARRLGESPHCLDHLAATDVSEDAGPRRDARGGPADGSDQSLASLLLPMMHSVDTVWIYTTCALM